MGLAQVAKCIPVTAEEGEGKAELAVYIVAKRYTLLTRWSGLVLKVGVSYGW